MFMFLNLSDYKGDEDNYKSTWEYLFKFHR